MTDPVTIVIPGKPVPKQRPRFNTRTRRTYTPVKTKLYEHLVGMKANREMAGREKLTGPLHLELLAQYTIPKSWPSAKRHAALLGEIAPSRADVDNIVKSVADACNNIVYRDDAQIVSITARKAYGMQEFVIATIKPVPNRVDATMEPAGA